MQDHDDSTPEGGDSVQLTPRQQREVTRLLVDARHTEPMPESVATRLDETLASLSAARHAPAAAPIDLAARRRTRRMRMLVAAAAVVVAAVTLPNYLPQMSGSDDASSSDSAGSAASEEHAPDTTLEDRRDLDSSADKESGGESDGGSAPQGTSTLDGSLSYLDAVRIRPEHFASDVLRATSDETAAGGYNQQRTARELRTALRALPGPVTRCVPDDASGRLFSASYDGRWGVLLVGPRVDGERRYELFMCGDPEFTRSVVLPAD